MLWLHGLCRRLERYRASLDDQTNDGVMRLLALATQERNYARDVMPPLAEFFMNPVPLPIAELRPLRPFVGTAQARGM